MPSMTYEIIEFESKPGWQMRMENSLLVVRHRVHSRTEFIIVPVIACRPGVRLAMGFLSMESYQRIEAHRSCADI